MNFLFDDSQPERSTMLSLQTGFSRMPALALPPSQQLSKKNSSRSSILRQLFYHQGYKSMSVVLLTLQSLLLILMLRRLHFPIQLQRKERRETNGVWSVLYQWCCHSYFMLGAKSCISADVKCWYQSSWRQELYMYTVQYPPKVSEQFPLSPPQCRVILRAIDFSAMRVIALK